MKYICFETDTGEEIVTFDNTTDHDKKAWACKRDSEGIMVPISAGFVTGGECCGRSVTLKLQSRYDTDTEILRKQISEVKGA